MIGRVFLGRYETIRLLGEGGMGRVYLARQLDLGRQVVVKVSGCTVHFADNVYDHGPIILQRVVPVLDDDTADTLAARVFEQECEAYPEAIRRMAEVEVR